MPWSRTAIRTYCPRFSIVDQHFFAGGENLIALDSRLVMT